MLASGRQPPDAATIKWKKNTIRNQEALTNEKHNQLEDISISKTRSRRGQWWWTRRWKSLRHPIHNLRLQFTDRWFTICILRVLLLVAGRFASLVRSGKISDDSLASGLGALPISLLLSLSAAGCPHSPRCPFLWLRRRLVRLPRNPQGQRMEIIMLRASPRVYHILLGISCVLPTSKKICQVKKELISNSLA